MDFEEHVAALEEMDREVDKRDGKISVLRADVRAVAAAGRFVLAYPDSELARTELRDALARRGVRKLLKAVKGENHGRKISSD